MVRRGTYSIVARDPDTGELGAAVQSHWFSVGSIVTWARPGVGAVCTQSIAEPAYGPRLLDALAGGAEAAGGEARGKQSSAMVVVPAVGEAWERTVDLRVEDHAEPLDELERLLVVHDAYALATRGDDLTGEGHHAEAGEAYRAAAALAP